MNTTTFLVGLVLVVGLGLVVASQRSNDASFLHPNYRWGADNSLIWINQAEAEVQAAQRGAQVREFTTVAGYILRLRLELDIPGLAGFRSIPVASLPSVLRLAYAFLAGSVALGKVSPGEAVNVAAELRADAVLRGALPGELPTWVGP